LLKRDYAPIIYLPSDLSETRKRFTVAHEIGHEYLGHPKKSGEFLDNPKQNREANCFAAYLLMPKKMFYDVWEEGEDYRGYCHIIRLAGRFNVSLTAATIRAEELGLVPRNRCRFCEERKDGRKCPL